MPVITQFPAGVKIVEQKSGVRRWVSIQADPFVKPGVIVIIFGLLIRTLPYFHMFRHEVVLWLRKPLLMPALKPIPCPSISLLDWSLPSKLFIPSQKMSGQVYFLCYITWFVGISSLQPSLSAFWRLSRLMGSYQGDSAGSHHSLWKGTVKSRVDGQ